MSFLFIIILNAVFRLRVIDSDMLKKELNNKKQKQNTNKNYYTGKLRYLVKKKQKLKVNSSLFVYIFGQYHSLENQ